MRENRTSGAKRVCLSRYARPRGDKSSAFSRVSSRLLCGIWYEPNHIVLYHVCVRTTLAANLSRGTYNIPNARNFHVTRTRCPLEGTAHAERSPCRIENPVLDGASRNAHYIPVLSKILCHAICYAMSAQKMSDRELLDLDRKRPRRVVSQWPFGRYAPRR